MKIIVLFLAAAGIFYLLITPPEAMSSLSGRYQGSGGFNYQFMPNRRAIIYFGNTQVGTVVQYKSSGRLIQLNPRTSCAIENRKTHQIFYVSDHSLLSTKAGWLTK